MYIRFEDPDKKKEVMEMLRKQGADVMSFSSAYAATCYEEAECTWDNFDDEELEEEYRDLTEAERKNISLQVACNFYGDGPEGCWDMLAQDMQYFMGESLLKEEAEYEDEDEE